MSAFPQQIDHLMVRVHDLDAAGRLFEQLGFTITPRSDFMGLANRLVCFAPPADTNAAFLELIAVEDPALAPAVVQAFLPPRDGPASIVMAGPDAAGFAEALSAMGLAVPAPLNLSREWRLGDEILTLAFSVCIPTHGQSPVSWSYIQHRTPQHYRRPEFLQHPNGAAKLLGLIVSTEAPLGVAVALSRCWGARIVTRDADMAELRLGAMFVRCVTPQQLAKRYAGVAEGPDTRIAGAVIGVSSLASLRKHMPGDWQANADGLHLPPHQTLDCLLAFEKN